MINISRYPRRTENISEKLRSKYFIYQGCLSDTLFSLPLNPPEKI